MISSLERGFVSPGTPAKPGDGGNAVCGCCFGTKAGIGAAGIGCATVGSAIFSTATVAAIGAATPGLNALVFSG